MTPVAPRPHPAAASVRVLVEGKVSMDVHVSSSSNGGDGGWPCAPSRAFFLFCECGRTQKNVHLSAPSSLVLLFAVVGLSSCLMDRFSKRPFPRTWGGGCWMRTRLLTCEPTRIAGMETVCTIV